MVINRVRVGDKASPDTRLGDAVHASSVYPSPIPLRGDSVVTHPLANFRQLNPKIRPEVDQK